ncbi:MAG TPA: AAA family ATPase, partial [Candidatus Babeliales bacterium]|nr:AAA family ATPase [Candidatus Babeliales bacterium]
MNKYYFLLLLVVSLKAEQEVPPVRVIHQSELREKLKPWNWNTQQKKLKPKYTPFKGLIGSFHPYLFYLRDTMQNENKRGVYEYQRTDEEASSKRFEQRHAIETFIEKRESFQREVGARIVLPEAYQDDDLGNNGILLVGASGTGKTTAVQCLARESGCKIIEVKPTGSYVAEGQEIIYKSLLDALQIATETGRRVILYFDECQVFTHESKNGRYDDPTARTLLWQMLDKYKLDPRILFVASTHKETGLDHAFQRRWRLIRFDKPSKEERVECLKTNAKKNGLDLMPETIETI